MTRVWCVDLRVHFSSTGGMHLFDSWHPASGLKMYLIYWRTIKCVKTVTYFNFVKRVHPLLKLNVSLHTSVHWKWLVNMNLSLCQLLIFQIFSKEGQHKGVLNKPLVKQKCENVSTKRTCYLWWDKVWIFSKRERSRSLYAIARLSVVCNVRVPYSGGSDFRQYFYGIRCLGHPWTSTENFTEIVPGREPLRRGS